MYGGLNLLKEKSEEIQKTNGISSDFYYISIFDLGRIFFIEFLNERYDLFSYF